MAQVVTLLSIDARGAEQGSAAYVRAMKAAQTAADRVLDAEERARVAREKGVALMIGQSDTIARTSRQWEKLRASIDPVIFATKELEKAQLQADAAVRRGITTQEEAARVVAQVRQKHAAALGLTNDNAPRGLAQHEAINLSRQAQDVATMLASGSSPMQVLATQSAQIVDIFSSSQATVGGFFRQLLGWVAPIAPIFTVATGAVVGFYSAFSVSSGRSEVERSLYGVGRAAGLTGDELNRLAKQSAEAGGITVDSARSIAAEFTRTGRIAPVIMNDLIRLSKAYALTTQQDLLPAAKELANAYADPVKGAELLNQKLGFLDATMLTAIRRSAEMGDRLRAQKLLTEGVASSVEQAEAAQSKWNRAWEKYISLPLARAKEAIGTAILPEDSIQQQERKLKDLASLNQQIRELREKPSNFAPSDVLPELERRRRQLEAEIKNTNDLATARKELVERNERSLGVQRTFEGANKEARTRDELNANINRFEHVIADRKKELEGLIQDPGRNSARIGDINQQVSDYELQVRRMTAAIKDYSGIAPGMTLEQDKQRRLLELQARSVNDVTIAQKAATEAERVRIDLRGTENSAVERTRMAEEARQKVLLQGQQQAADQRRASQDNVEAANAEAEALRKGGVAAGELARLKAQALRDVRGTGQNSDVRYQELLMEAQAKVTREITEQTLRQRDQVGVARAVVDQAQKQGLSEQQVAALMQRKLELQQQLERLRGAGASSEAMAQAERDLIALKEQELSIDQRRQALGLIYGQNEQLAGLQQEISLIGSSADERNRLIAVMRAEQELRRAGIPLGSAEAQQYVANASTISGLTTVRDSLIDIQSAGRDALKGFISDMRAGKSGAEAFSNVLNRLLDKMLDMSISALFGGSGSNGWLTKLFGGFGFGGGGSMPTISSGTGGLYAFGGYTGSGGMFDPAGIVHRGEFVFSAASVNRIGLSNLDKMHRGSLRGYAGGGYAGPAPAYMPPPSDQNGGMKVVINNTVSDRTQVTAERDQNGDLRVMVKAIQADMAEDLVHGKGSLNQAIAARQNNQTLRG